MDLDVGPLIRQSQQQRVWDFLSDAQVAGIPMVAQGQIVDEAPDTGFYQAPTLLRDVPVMHRLAQEEVFGPVLAILPYRDDEEAIAIANDTVYGLSGYVSGTDPVRLENVVSRLRAGNVHVNGAGLDFKAPFGGYKQSGNGRDKSLHALDKYCELKTTWIRFG